MADSSSLRWWNSPRTLLRYILMLDDTSHSIALGTAIGMFIGLTPTVGIQMILVMVVAGLTGRLFQFNRVAALLTVYVSNPLTVVPIYWVLYKVGTTFVGGHLTREDLAGMLEYQTLQEWQQTIVTLFVEVGGPLIVGTCVVATIGGFVTYPVMRWLLRSFHSVKPSGSDSERGSVPGSEKEPITQTSE